MSFQKIFFLYIIILISQLSVSQIKDTTKLTEVQVKGFKTVNGIGHLSDAKDGIIYAGKKNEMIHPLINSILPHS